MLIKEPDYFELLLDRHRVARNKVDEEKIRENEKHQKKAWDREAALAPDIYKLLSIASKCGDEKLFDSNPAELFLPDRINKHKDLEYGLIYLGNQESGSADCFSDCRTHDYHHYMYYIFAVRRRCWPEQKNVFNRFIMETAVFADKEGIYIASYPWTRPIQYWRPYHASPENIEILLDSFEKFEPVFYDWLDRKLNA